MSYDNRKTLDAIDKWAGSGSFPEEFKKHFWQLSEWDKFLMSGDWSKRPINSAKTQTRKEFYLPKPEPPTPPVINKKAKPPEQRESILQEIAFRGWDQMEIPPGGVELLKLWFMEAYGEGKKKESVFRDRWKELKKAKVVDAVRNPRRKKRRKK